MFGLQKQRRNAAGGGAWFIAGHLTVFAKLSHHAVPLESRIFSSRCFSSSVPPPSCPTLPSPLPWFCRLLSLSFSRSYLSAFSRYHPTKAAPSQPPAGSLSRLLFLRKTRADFRISFAIRDYRNADRIISCETTLTVEGYTRYKLRVFR